MANPINTSVPALPQGGSVSRSGPQSSSVIPGEGRQTAATGGKAAPAEAAAAPAQPSAGDVARATRDISDYIQTVSRTLDISVDDDLGRIVVTVSDKETGEKVRQIPSEEVLAIARFLKEQQADSENSDAVRVGLLVNKET